MSDASSPSVETAPKVSGLRVLACLDPTDGAGEVIQRAAQCAGQLGAPWEAVYVATPSAAYVPVARREALLFIY